MPEEQRIIRNVEISAALDGGFAIRDRDSYELLAVVPNLVGVEPRLRAIFATAVTVKPDFAEVGDTVVKSNAEEMKDLPSSFYIGNDGQRGASARRAAANVILKVKAKNGGYAEYGFIDEIAGHTAYCTLIVAGAEVVKTKSRDSDIIQPAKDTPVEVDSKEEAPAEEERDTRYLVTVGESMESANKQTAVWDHHVATAMVQAAQDAGGYGHFETIPHIS